MITITAENYYRIYNQIKRFSLPDHIQKGAKFIDKVTNYGRNWKAYFDPYSSTYRDFANNYFAQLSKFIDEELKKSVVYERLQKHDSHSETGTRQRTNGSTRTRRKVRKSVSKPQKPPVQKAKRPTLRKPSEVSKLDEAVYIIKRYYNMHNDRKTYQQILNFTNDLQLALMDSAERR